MIIWFVLQSVSSFSSELKERRGKTLSHLSRLSFLFTSCLAEDLFGGWTTRSTTGVSDVLASNRMRRTLGAGLVIRTSRGGSKTSSSLSLGGRRVTDSKTKKQISCKCKKGNLGGERFSEGFQGQIGWKMCTCANNMKSTQYFDLVSNREANNLSSTS